MKAAIAAMLSKNGAQSCSEVESKLEIAAGLKEPPTQSQVLGMLVNRFGRPIGEL